MEEQRSAGTPRAVVDNEVQSRVVHETLIPLLRAIITGGEIPPLVLTQNLVTFYTSQQLIGFLHTAVRSTGDAQYPEDAVERVKKCYALSVAQQVQQDYYREQIFSALAAAGIPYLPLKGEALRAVYPSPDLRFSCDIDFFYDASRRDEVNAILAGMGFSRERSDAHNDSFMRGAVHVEPHFALTDPSEPYAAYYDHIWDRLVTDDGIRHRFTDEDLYVYLLLHTYKHFLHGGSGARSVMDAYLWRRAHPDMDTAQLAEAYAALGIARFVTQFERLGRVWFEGEADDADTRLLTAWILSGGAYGAMTQDAVMDAARRGKPDSARFRYLLRRVFLPYRFMCLRYPVVKRAPILYPFAQVVRWFSVLFSRDRKRIAQDLRVAGAIASDDVDAAARVWALVAPPEVR